MISTRRHRGLASVCGAAVLVLTAAGCSSSPSPSSDQNASSATTQTEATTEPTASASASPASGLLYSAKPASFSAVWAVEQGCPVVTHIAFADTGPKLGTQGLSEEGGTPHPPGITWSPPCSGMTQELSFHPSAAKVSGTQTQESCQKAVDKAKRDGSLLPAVSPRSLAAGDEFCEDDKDTGRVVLMQLTNASTNDPVKLDWSFTAWAVPKAEPTLAPAGATLYTDQTFTLSDKKATGGGCVPASASLSTPDGPQVFYGQNQTSGDIAFFPGCIGGLPAKIRFGGHTAPVSGTPDIKTCEDTAAASPKNTLDVNLTELRPGNEYCEFTTLSKAVVMVKVVSVTSSPASIQLSATAWKAPDTP